MASPICMLVLGKGFTEAWYQLSKEDQDILWAQFEEVDEQAGTKWLVLCNSRWADEDVFDWGVLEYPDFDAYQKKVAALEELQFWRYFKTKTILGTRMELPV